MTTEDLRKYIVDADEAQALFGKLSTPYAYLVDSLPWRKSWSAMMDTFSYLIGQYATCLISSLSLVSNVKPELHVTSLRPSR